ncbi:MAG: hypothetical protein IPH62_04560 [Ignavibacteriae bacterium]|nr:hypothetical protein [Ignavibacteriota bacterium]
MKAKALSSISDFYKVTEISEMKSETFEDGLLRINKIKYNLGLVYFAAVTILLTSLFV